MRAVFGKFVGEGPRASAVIDAAYAKAMERGTARISRAWAEGSDDKLREARYLDHMARNDRPIVMSDGRVSDPAEMGHSLQWR